MTAARHGALTKTNLEWGRKDRKREDQDRNLNARARREQINEQIADLRSECGRHPDCLFQGGCVCSQIAWCPR